MLCVDDTKGVGRDIFYGLVDLLLLTLGLDANSRMVWGLLILIVFFKLPFI